jgi:hypothetical protein
MGRCFSHSEGILMSASLASLKRPTRRRPLAVGVAAVLALSGSAAVHAATWFVNDCTDGTAAGQFRWAANGAVSGDTIDLTTQLTPAGYPNCGGALNGFNHLLNVSSTVTLAGGVTVVGPGETELAIWYHLNNGRVISAGGDLTMSNLAVKYGGGVTTGACIRATGNITLTSVEAFKCETYSNAGSARGGAIYSFVGNVTMTGSYVTGSSATSVSGSVRGGSVYGFTGVSLTNTTIKSSTATSSTGSAEGGGVFNFGSSSGSLYVNSSYISGTASVTGATGGHAYGGALASRGTTFVTNYTFIENGSATTQSGGAARGGGIYSIGNATLQNSSNIFFSGAYSKSGASRGGGIYTKGSATVWYSSVQANGASRGSATYSSNGLSTKYSMFFGNSASSGGGLINKTAGNTTVRGSVFWNNGGFGWTTVDAYAGGSTTITIENSTVTGNTASNSSAAMYLLANSVTVDNTTVAYNTSASGSPAVIILGSGTSPTVEMHSTLMASNPSGAGRNDVQLSGTTFSGTSSNNFIRDPGSGVPGDTIVGQCPFLHAMKQDFSEGGGYWGRWVMRPAIKSAEVDAGSNPLNLATDQRGGSVFASTPPRASGPGPNNASPIPDIGAYEIDQNDIIFDSEFDTCQ